VLPEKARLDPLEHDHLEAAHCFASLKKVARPMSNQGRVDKQKRSDRQSLGGASRSCETKQERYAKDSIPPENNCNVTEVTDKECRVAGCEGRTGQSPFTAHKQSPDYS
jgi:hypothetical protein